MKNFVLYKGHSVLDGAPIVVLAVINTSNPKTAGMIQTHILRDDMSPLDATRTMEDVSICGVCPLRQNRDGACYVNIGQGPESAWKAYKRGKYAEPSLETIQKWLSGRVLRLGSYGDPAAVPFEVWEQALSGCRKTTGYTHQMSHKNFDPRILKYCIVSADTAKQAAGYHSRDYRTFRIVTDYDQLFDNEVICKDDSEGMTCLECGLCDGALNSKPSIAILVHGTRTRKHTEKYGNANLIAVAG
jgi:hypothetical protein